jgi:hypothetical protein
VAHSFLDSVRARSGCLFVFAENVVGIHSYLEKEFFLANGFLERARDSGAHGFQGIVAQLDGSADLQVNDVGKVLVRVSHVELPDFVARRSADIVPVWNRDSDSGKSGLVDVLVTVSRPQSHEKHLKLTKDLKKQVFVVTLFLESFKNPCFSAEFEGFKPLTTIY